MFRNIKKVFQAIAIAGVILFVGINSNQLHNDYLRSSVGSSTVQVLSPTGGGGTGFSVKAASGNLYIMTNKHVCEAGQKGWMLIKQDEGESVYKRIVYKDNKHDLCLIEGDKRFSPLSLGYSPAKGEFIYVVGHPGLRQLTVSSGEYIGFSPVKLLDAVKTRKECRGEIYELNPMEQFFYGIEFACIRTYVSYATTAVSYPGNSGSPVVNKYGNVIGVLFAGSNQQERDNYIVPLYEVKRVLNKF